MDLHSNAKTVVSIDDDCGEIERHLYLELKSDYENLQGKHQELQEVVRQLRREKEEWQYTHLVCNREQEKVQEQLTLLRTELAMEKQRSSRKIDLVQRNRRLVIEECGIAKEELADRHSKLDRLQRQLEEFKKAKSNIKEDNPDKYNKHKEIQQHCSSLLAKKEEEVNKLKSVISEQNGQLKALAGQVSRLQQQMSSKDALLEQVKANLTVQLEFAQQENKFLQQQIDSLSSRLRQRDENQQRASKKDSDKWRALYEQLNKQKEMYEIKGKTWSAKQSQILREIERKGQQNLQLKEQIQKLTLSLNWHRQVLQEAKTDFIHAQLMQQQKADKIAKEKKDLVRRQKYLEQEICTLRHGSTKSSRTNLVNSRSKLNSSQIQSNHITLNSSQIDNNCVYLNNSQIQHREHSRSNTDNSRNNTENSRKLTDNSHKQTDHSRISIDNSLLNVSNSPIPIANCRLLKTTQSRSSKMGDSSPLTGKQNSGKDSTVPSTTNSSKTKKFESIHLPCTSKFNAL